jgi:hypothetical protein
MRIWLLVWIEVVLGIMALISILPVQRLSHLSWHFVLVIWWCWHSINLIHEWISHLLYERVSLKGLLMHLHLQVIILLRKLNELGLEVMELSLRLLALFIFLLFSILLILELLIDLALHEESLHGLMVIGSLLNGLLSKHLMLSALDLVQLLFSLDEPVLGSFELLLSMLLLMFSLGILKLLLSKGSLLFSVLLVLKGHLDRPDLVTFLAL